MLKMPPVQKMSRWETSLPSMLEAFGLVCEGQQIRVLWIYGIWILGKYMSLKKVRISMNLVFTTHRDLFNLWEIYKNVHSHEMFTQMFILCRPDDMVWVHWKVWLIWSSVDTNGINRIIPRLLVIKVTIYMTVHFNHSLYCVLLDFPIIISVITQQ